MGCAKYTGIDGEREMLL